MLVHDEVTCYNSKGAEQGVESLDRLCSVLPVSQLVIIWAEARIYLVQWAQEFVQGQSEHL